MRPPKFAERLLAWSVPEDDRVFMLGDCAEEHAAIAAARGRPAADRWYRAQVLRSIVRNLRRRNQRAPSPPKDPFVTTLWLDIRYALRQLRRSPGFAAPAILTLALGIAAATAVFTVVNRVVLRPLPYPDPERLIRLWDRNEAAGLAYFSVSPANYFAWRQHSRTVQTIGAYREDGFTIATADGGERVDGARVTWSMFDVLHVLPAAGRPIHAADDQPGASNVVVLSEALAERLNQAPGRSITIDGRSHLVVGVLPRSFHYPQQPQVQLLVPYALDSAKPEAGAHFLRVLARLRPGATVEQARAEFATIAASLDSGAPQSNRGWTVAIQPLHTAVVGDVEQPLYLLLGAAILLLVITCANVAGLLLARGASRESELAVRAALGAGSHRLARQLVTESLVLSAIGGVAGLAMSRVGLDALLAIDPDVLPRASEIVVDMHVVGFVAIVCTVTGLAFGTVPSLVRTRASGLREGLAGSGRTPGARAPRLRRLLVASEIAVALALTTGAALLVTNLRGLQQVDPGFDIENVLTMELRTPAGTYGDPKSRVRLFQQIVDELERIPGVKAAGGAHRLPLDGNSAIPLVLAGQAPSSTTPPSVNYRAVAGNYFAALGMDIVKGRPFSNAEMWDGGSAAIVNQAAVERYFGALDPLTQRLLSPGKGELQVVGVVQDVREDALDEPAAPALYLPYATAPSPAMVLLVSTTTPPSGLARATRFAINQVDPSLALAKIRPLRQFMTGVVATPRFNATLLGTFACLALALAAVGIYGVTAYSVAQRAPEIGVRVALGARPADIFRAVVVPGLVLAAIGTAAGVFCALAIARLLGGAILGVNVNQPAILVMASAALFIIAALATLIPARRALQIDPIVALRTDR
jgi:putative ABC transport system permease protein